MHKYPEDIEARLGFDQIRNILVKECHSERGRTLARRAKPTDKYDVLKRWLDQVTEMVRLRASGNDRLTFEFPDIDDYLKRIKVPGSFLDPDDFHVLKIGIRTISAWNLFFSESGDEYMQLSGLSPRTHVDELLVSEIDRILDERGEIRDNASPDLLEIRTSITKSERSVRSAIQKVLKKAKQDNFTEEDSSLTVREGRLVIPVKAEFKKRIQGFVHDESATGQTVYLEPGEVLELNNQVKELKYKERREVFRILQTLSDLVRANLPALQQGTDLLEKLDFIHAKAKLGELLNGNIPKLEEKPISELFNAVHPLLFLSHKESGKSVVPLSLHLNVESRILIISGPNAGGKSVALKTVGLLHYMFQTGLPIPVKEESRLGIFSSIFIDIGDTQSIEDDVSTYSAHLTSMRHFLMHSNRKTLFLIDEFGKGTEPQFGGAVAESVLHSLNKKKAFGVITTHYQNLKKIGDETPGLINGAMKYDLDALEPLFELEIGKPGSSFAFEIAQKIGLPAEIIDSAKKNLGKTHVEYDQMLSSLEKEKSKYEKQSKKLENDQKDLIHVRNEYEQLKNLIEDDKGKILKEAKNEARRIVQGANKEIERVVREIKESSASKEKTMLARERVEKIKAEFKEAKPAKRVKVVEGDHVQVEGQDMVGVVKKINGRQAEVLFGGLKSIVGIDKLTVTQKETPSYQREKKVKKLGIDISQKMANFSHELTLRGMRAEEAMSKVESFIDEALLLGMDEVRVIHGKGHGVLRNIVRNFTKDHPRIASVSDEHADRGGDGISIIKLQ